MARDETDGRAATAGTMYGLDGGERVSLWELDPACPIHGDEEQEDEWCEDIDCGGRSAGPHYLGTTACSGQRCSCLREVSA